MPREGLGGTTLRYITLTQISVDSGFAKTIRLAGITKTKEYHLIILLKHISYKSFNWIRSLEHLYRILG